jgi:hypothetical protein
VKLRYKTRPAHPKEEGKMANGKLTTAEKAAWNQFQSQISEILHVFGGILLLPLIMLVGFGWGFRAGIIAGMEKGLQMFREWGGES